MTDPNPGTGEWYMAEARAHLEAADADPSGPTAVPRLLAAQANASMAVFAAVSDLQNTLFGIEERMRG